MKVKSILFLFFSLAITSLHAQRIKGSDTVLPVAQQTAERFMNKHADARVTVTGGGTGVGRIDGQHNRHCHGFPSHQVQ